MVELGHVVGAVGYAETIVGTDNTAVTMGVGSLPIFATPALAALAEQAAIAALQSYLPLGSTTVGTNLNLKHIAATPIGHNIAATAVVSQIEGRRITFRITVKDEREKIGEGVHERFMIDAAGFMGKLMLKKPKS